MNTRLVESLLQIIQSLTPEEQIFLEEKLKQQKLSSEQHKREQIRNKIYERRKGEPFNPPIEEYIYITRDERNAQQDEILRDCFGDKANS